MGDINVTAVVNPWQAIVVIAFIVIVLGLPQISTMRNSRQANGHAKRAADEIEHQSKPNSGLSMTDKLDRIEVAVSVIPELVQRVASLERAAEKRARPWRWPSIRLVRRP